MSTIHAEIKALEAEKKLIDTLRSMAKTDGGRLTDLGVDLVYTLNKHGVKKGDAAKILDVTPAAISQQIDKLKQK